MQSHLASHRSPRARYIVLGLALLSGGALNGTAFAQPPSTDGSGVANGVARVATSAILAADVPADTQETTAVSERPVPAPVGFIAEPRIIRRAVRLLNNRAISDNGRQNNGFYPDFSNMVTGSGWISIGPGYRHWLFGDRAIVDASTAMSWRSYKTAQARFELPTLARSRVAVGSQLLLQDLTQVTYFGLGAASPDTDRSEYRMKTTDVVGYATVRPVRSVAIVGRVGWLKSPLLSQPGGSFERGNPGTELVFPGDAVFARVDQPNYLHGEASITADTRDFRSHPTNGGVYRAAFTTYSDRDTGAFSFRRYEAELAHFTPVWNPRVVLALHGWVVGSETDSGRQVPFYLMPSLGGGNTLRAYSDYRFHDRNLLLMTAEARVALMTHVDLATFVDAGSVAPRMSGLNLDTTSYGIGLRVHTDRARSAASTWRTGPRAGESCSGPAIRSISRGCRAARRRRRSFRNRSAEGEKRWARASTR